MKARIRVPMKELLEQAKKAEALVAELREKIAKVDKAAAKATAKTTVETLKTLGLEEANKIRDRLQHQVMDLTVDLAKTSERLKIETDKVKGRVQESLKSVTAHLKTITEEQRKKRGRSRPE